MDVVKLAVGLFRPKYIPVVLGKIFEITGRRLDAFGLRIMGPTAPSEKFSTHRRLVHIQNQRATLGESLFIAPSATVVGPVSIDDATAVMYGVVIRGDIMKVKIGKSVFLGDHTVVAPPLTSQVSSQCLIGSRVYIGTGVNLSSCTLEDNCVIGNASVIGAGVVVGKGAIVAGGSCVPAGTIIPAGQYWSGSPARFVRAVSADETQARATELDRVLEISDRHNYWHDLTIENREILKMTLSRDPSGDEMRRREDKDPDYEYYK